MPAEARNIRIFFPLLQNVFFSLSITRHQLKRKLVTPSSKGEKDKFGFVYVYEGAIFFSPSPATGYQMSPANTWLIQVIEIKKRNDKTQWCLCNYLKLIVGSHL